MTDQIAFAVVIILFGWALCNALYPVAQEFVIGLTALERAQRTLDTVENEEK